MIDAFVAIGVFFLLACLGGLGYFSIWRLTDQTRDKVFSYQKTFRIMVTLFQSGKDILATWNKRFLDLETEIRLQKNDSSRLIEWLAKERETREADRVEFLKALRITERESKIIEISERLKLITTRK